MTKAKGIIFGAMAGLLLSSPCVMAEWDFVVDARPATLLINGQADDFEATHPADPDLGLGGAIDKEDAGQLTSFPNIHVGAARTGEKIYFDLTGGLGFLANDRIQASMYGLDASLHFKQRKNISMGPHIGLWQFSDPTWHGDAEVDLDGDTGLIFGFEVAIGYDILFVFAIDYLSASFDASPGDAVTRISDTELDISGLAVQFGMRGNF